jgi:hypothetical protein
VLGQDHFILLSLLSFNILSLLFTSERFFCTKAAMNEGEQLLGPDHSDTLLLMNNLTLLYMNQGEYERAQLTCEGF